MTVVYPKGNVYVADIGNVFLTNSKIKQINHSPSKHNVEQKISKVIISVPNKEALTNVLQEHHVE